MEKSDGMKWYAQTLMNLEYLFVTLHCYEQNPKPTLMTNNRGCKEVNKMHAQNKTPTQLPYIIQHSQHHD